MSNFDFIDMELHCPNCGNLLKAGAWQTKDFEPTAGPLLYTLSELKDEVFTVCDEDGGCGVSIAVRWEPYTNKDRGSNSRSPFEYTIRLNHLKGLEKEPLKGDRDEYIYDNGTLIKVGENVDV